VAELGSLGVIYFRANYTKTASAGVNTVKGNTNQFYTMKKLIAIMAVCLFVSAAYAADLTNSAVFQIRLVLGAASTNSDEMSVAYDIGNGAVHRETYDVQKTVPFDLSAVKSATVIENIRYNGLFQVEVTLTDEARKRFADFSRQNVGKRIACIIDGQLDSAPVLKSEISDGKVWVGSSDSEQKAKDMAAKINAAITKR
jgi:preprotein translocase subunit SecD